VCWCGELQAQRCHLESEVNLAPGIEPCQNCLVRVFLMYSPTNMLRMPSLYSNSGFFLTYPGCASYGEHTSGAVDQELFDHL